MKRFDKEIKIIEESGLFDRAWYLNEYPDVKASGMDPIEHYLWVGAKLGRNPGPGFDTKFYLEENGDVGEANVNPLLHFIEHGEKEGRIFGTKTLNGFSKTPAEIILNTSQTPVVSVIIPIYGKLDYTLMCLESIMEHEPALPYEVIVVDDKSPDDSHHRLAQIKGLRLVQNAENSGFIVSCNHGASVSDGEYLLFLNNDTEVHNGWLDELHSTFSLFSGTGLAGSKLIYPDGTLQEAGGIVWQDASAWNFGNRQNPDLPEFNYAREASYLSGASIMVPKKLFDKVGGFDEIYRPAYYEDTDLAMKVRESGHRVIYQPFSVITHHDGVTSGNDICVGVKSYQVKNREKFHAKWEHRLRDYQPNGVNVNHAKDRSAKWRVLVVDACTPTPDKDSGSIDAYNLLVILMGMGFRPTFIPEDNFLYMEKYTPMLQRVGVEMLYSPYCTSVEQHIMLEGDRYDLVFLIRPLTVEKNIKSIRKYCSRAKIIYHTVDLHHLRMFREYEVKKEDYLLKDAEEMKQRELSCIQDCDLTTVVSEKEKEVLDEELPGYLIEHMPYARAITGTRVPYSQRRDILFIGGYQHTPNVDAVIYFVSEIMPEVRKLLPDVRFMAAGSNTPELLNGLASDDVIIPGFVEDLQGLMDGVRLTVAPLRYGAGIKGKVGSALSFGVPTVATSLAVEGMGLTDGIHIMVADDPREFAQKIAALYLNEQVWVQMQRKGLEKASEKFGEKSAWRTVKMILGKLGFTIAVEPERGLRLYN